MLAQIPEMPIHTEDLYSQVHLLLRWMWNRIPAELHGRTVYRIAISIIDIRPVVRTRQSINPIIKFAIKRVHSAYLLFHDDPPQRIPQRVILLVELVRRRAVCAAW